MKKQILNLGTALNKDEQKTIIGGNSECWECLPGHPVGTLLGCSYGEVCQVEPDGCNFCVLR